MKQPATKEILLSHVKKCETARMWMVVLAALLLLGGYVTGVMPVLYACVLPLAIAGALTYWMKSLQKRADALEEAAPASEEEEDA